MPRQDVLISQKFNNYNYAPGIATYGADGKTGIAGYDGNNIYFTDCDLINDIDNRNLNDLAELLRGKYLPVKGSTTAISRSYKNDDLFFDQNGIIYKLKNIDELIGTVNKDTYGKYFSIAGKISVSDSSYFDNVDGRIILNSSNFGGFDVITSSDLSTNIDSNAVVNIISSNIDENDNIELIKMQSIDDVDIEDGNLDIYYKTTDNAYYLDSNMPIVINSNVKINDSADNIDYDNYSSILTSNDPITYFKHICDKLRYNVLYDSDKNRYKLVIYQEDRGRDDLEYLVNRNETVYGKVYDIENDQVLLKLTNIIDGSIGSIDYTYINTPYDCSINNSSCHDTSLYIPNNEIKYIPASKMHINNNYDHNIKKLDVSIKFSIYSDQIGNFSVQANNNDIIQIYNNSNNKYVFTFKKQDAIEPKIKLIPNIKFKCENSSSLTYSPIELSLQTSNLINNNIYSLYFKLNYNTDDTNSSILSINDIMIFDRNDLINVSDISVPHIETYLPNSVESIQKFALLHNTEIFINYQE